MNFFMIIPEYTTQITMDKNAGKYKNLKQLSYYNGETSPSKFDTNSRIRLQNKKNSLHADDIVLIGETENKFKTLENYF